MTHSLSRKKSVIAIPVKGTTKIVGIFGDPVVYTLSPRMHNYAFSKLNLDFVYVPFLVKPENLKGAVESLHSLNLVGVNVTIPHKKNVIRYLDSVSPLAQKIGAVNTIVNKNGRLIGHNTDASGFISTLEEDGKFNARGKNAVIMGAGGVAHAIGAALIESGIRKLVIFDKFQKVADSLCGHLKNNFKGTEFFSPRLLPKMVAEEMKECDLFVNATPCEVNSSFLGIPADQFLSEKVFVFDAIYGRETGLISEAKKRGCRFLGGLGMLIRQGAIAFSLWTGKKPPVQLMKEALKYD